MPSTIQPLKTHQCATRIGKCCFVMASLLQATSAHSAPQSVSTDVPYQVRGYCELVDTSLFSITDLRTGGSRWVKSNQVFDEITILSFDLRTGLFAALYQGREVYLKLKDAGESTGRIASWDQPQDEAPLTASRIEQLVNEHERTLMSQLPEKTHRLHAPMKVSINNQLIAYKAELYQELEEQTSIEQATPSAEPASDLKPRIGSLRESNEVNSRIWASDHIEIHGEPLL
ncbi:MAG: hypothetical protein ACSHYA_05590 [Opitutaceae bacterium]